MDEEEFKSSQVAEVLDKLDAELIGLKPVKTRIREIAALLLVERMRRRLAISADTLTLHMCFTGNPGMHSRIAHHLDFPDYSAEELLAIAKLMLAQMNYRFSEEAERVFAEYIRRRMQQPHFANARSIRNALDRCRLRQANRLFARRTGLTKLDLMTIEADDIRASRVFTQDSGDHTGET